MQTVKQIVCSRCRELNLPFLSICAFCGQTLSPPGPPILNAATPPVHLESDLPPLLWALACFFLALWALVAAGPLQGLLGVLTHPYLLIACVLVSLIVTGIFLAERLTREPPIRALISTRDLMALCWTTAAMLAAGQIVKYVMPPIPVITRYQMLDKDRDGCRVEVFVKGQDGDELWRLTELSRKSDKEIVGVVVRHSGGGSARLPMTKRTPDGDCTIAKYHLIVDGKESDQVDGISHRANDPR